MPISHDKTHTSAEIRQGIEDFLKSGQWPGLSGSKLVEIIKLGADKQIETLKNIDLQTEADFEKASKLLLRYMELRETPKIVMAASIAGLPELPPEVFVKMTQIISQLPEGTVCRSRFAALLAENKVNSIRVWYRMVNTD